MDPNSTLFTFMLQTDPAVRSVCLIGSWDNFSKPYPMERDSRRHRGQWRGCYSFNDVVRDRNRPPRERGNDGLKMGNTYYYYYELDGCQETHDETLPSTTHCPYLPGQAVNTLEVPMEKVLRQRSASLSSMRIADFKTMNPSDKFVSPRPPPPAPFPMALAPRLGSSPLSQTAAVNSPRSDSAASLPAAPSPVWRRFFARKSSSRSSNHLPPLQLNSRSTSPSDHLDDSRARSSSLSSSRSRNISPESLRRFLADDAPPTDAHAQPSILIPENIAEEPEDDDNFASSAVSENCPYMTCLSPPPFKRCHSDGSIPTVTNGSQMTLTMFTSPAAGDGGGHDYDDGNADCDPAPTQQSLADACSSEPGPPSLSSPTTDTFSVSLSPIEDESLPPYDSNDDDDMLSSNDDDTVSNQSKLETYDPRHSEDLEGPPIEGYFLPDCQNPAEGFNKSNPSLINTCAPAGSPALVARSDDAGVPLGNTHLLTIPGDHGIEDFVNEMSWMVDVIRDRES